MHLTAKRSSIVPPEPVALSLLVELDEKGEQRGSDV